MNNHNTWRRLCLLEEWMSIPSPLDLNIATGTGSPWSINSSTFTMFFYCDLSYQALNLTRFHQSYRNTPVHLFHIPAVLLVLLQGRFKSYLQRKALRSRPRRGCWLAVSACLSGQSSRGSVWSPCGGSWCSPGCTASLPLAWCAEGPFLSGFKGKTEEFVFLQDLPPSYPQDWWSILPLGVSSVSIVPPPSLPLCLMPLKKWATMIRFLTQRWTGRPQHLHGVQGQRPLLGFFLLAHWLHLTELVKNWHNSMFHRRTKQAPNQESCIFFF